MRNSLKVAKWEIKRNMKNKSFIIGLFLTPLIFLFFAIVPGLFSDSDEEAEMIDVFIKDELQLIDEIRTTIEQNDFLDWSIHGTDMDEASILDQVEASENMVYIPLTSTALDEGLITIYTSEEIDDHFMTQVGFIEEPLRQLQLEKLGLSTEELEGISRGVVFESATTINDEEIAEEELAADLTDESDSLARIIPGAFAGIILFSIVISGMMIFQSASQEKKDKIAEIILSSLTPNELMQGKIIGYFVLGIVQVLVWLAFAIPIIIWKLDLPILEYLFVPELALLLLIAILGYLLFAAIFVGIGATIEDISTSGNFQGMVLMLPFLPFVLIGPILDNPTGLIAQIGSYIPFTSPGILIIRLSMLEEWPWIEIAIAVAILIVSVWLFMKLAGKIFKIGILMYGKNATPKEIWKWLWA
jgi:ABC-2 type transport system permease protein